MHKMRFAPIALALGFLANGSLASQVIWVDDDGGPGVDFTDIQPAIGAAQSGDVIFVHPGAYSSFTLNHGVTILGSGAGTTHVAGVVTISDLVGPHRAVLSRLHMQDLMVLSNQSTVILDDLEISYTGSVLNPGSSTLIRNCTDVRLYSSTLKRPYAGYKEPSRDNLRVVNSRLEIVDSNLEGSHGQDDLCATPAAQGGAALVASHTSILSVFATSCQGGWGGIASSICFPSEGDGGAGGDALRLEGGSLAVVVGAELRGGGGGQGGGVFGGGVDGPDGWGLNVLGLSGARQSNTFISSQQVQSGSFVDVATPTDPSLDRIGTLQAGRLQTFRVYGPPGSSAVLYLGRSPIVDIDPMQEMDNLVTHDRAYNLGVIPASGNASFTLTIPITFPVGFSFFAQGEVTSGTESRLTNSLPMVIRHLP